LITFTNYTNSIKKPRDIKQNITIKNCNTKRIMKIRSCSTPSEIYQQLQIAVPTFTDSVPLISPKSINKKFKKFSCIYICSFSFLTAIFGGNVRDFESCGAPLPISRKTSTRSRSMFMTTTTTTKFSVSTVPASLPMARTPPSPVAGVHTVPPVPNRGLGRRSPTASIMPLFLRSFFFSVS